MSTKEQVPAEKTIERDDMLSFVAPVPPFLPTELASPTYATTLLSHQHDGLLLSNLGTEFTPSPPRSRKPEAVDPELVVSCTTPPTPLPDIHNLILSNETDSEQDYSPTSPGSPFSPLQLPPATHKPSILGQNISKEIILDAFIAKFVGYAEEAFKKVDAECVEPDYTWQSRTFASFALEQHNKDTNNKHMWGSFIVFFMFCISAAHLWQNWHDIVIATILFLYLAVMINLWLVRGRDQKRRELEAACEVILRGPELMSSLMLVATIIMMVSFGVVVFIFRPNWDDLGLVAVCISASTLVIFFLIKMWEIDRKKRLKEKCKVVSDLV